MTRATWIGVAGLVAGSALMMASGCPSTTGGGGGQLTLSLDSSLGGEGDVKATSINSATLLDKSGATVATATVTNGSAVLGTDSLTAGDYYLLVNGLGDDLVPTRIVDGTSNTIQFTEGALQESVIGSLASPTYRLKTFPKGLDSRLIVKYSDGTDVSPAEYAYAVVTMSANKFEMAVLGTGAGLLSYTGAATHASGGQAFAGWALHVQSDDHHGEGYDGTDANCSACHGNLDTKPAQYSSISVANGWCYKCHYGKTGPEAGFVDPAQ